MLGTHTSQKLRGFVNVPRYTWPQTQVELVESPRFALMTPDVVDLVLCTLEKASGAGRSFKPESDEQGAFYS